MTQYTIGSGLEWEVAERHDKTWLLLIDGTPIAVRLQREYGAGPYPILWSAYSVEYTDGKPMLVDTLGSFHHASHDPNDHLAGYVWSLFKARLDEAAEEANDEAEEANV